MTTGCEFGGHCAQSPAVAAQPRAGRPSLQIGCGAKTARIREISARSLPLTTQRDNSYPIGQSRKSSSRLPYSSRGEIWQISTPISAAIGGALIGLAAVLLMLFNGRIAGVSGIADGLFNPRTDDRLWRLAFIVGLIAAPLAAALVGHAVPMPQMPASYDRHRGRRPAGRVRHQARQRLHLRPRHLRHRAAVAALDRGDAGVHDRRHHRRRADAPRHRRLTPCRHSQAFSADSFSAWAW